MLIDNLGLRMKKIFTILFLFLFCFSFSSASLIDIYKKGKIKLVPDSKFGNGTEWDMYFPQGIKDIAFTKGGSFFATGLGNKAGHCVYKFDKNGKLIKKFGQKGKGPGDFYAPGNLSILDNKYLVIAEYATSRRISIFDLNGNFVKIIRTKWPVFDVADLKGDKIAILTIQGKENKGKSVNSSFSVCLRNIKTGAEKKIRTYSEAEIMSPIAPRSFYGKVCMEGTKGGNLILGFSSQNSIEILSSNGKVFSNINLGYKRREVNEKEKRAFCKNIEEMLKNMKNKRRTENVKKLLNKVKYPEYGPCYNKMIVDGMGNILVLRGDTMFSSKEYETKIFTDKGKSIGTIKIERRDNPEYFGIIRFYKNYVYYFDKEDETLKRAIMK